MEILYEVFLFVVKELYNVILNFVFIYLKNIDFCVKSCLVSILYFVFFIMLY